MQLSGGAIRHLSRESVRVRALQLARDNVARFLQAREPAAVYAAVRRRWTQDPLTVVRITAVAADAAADPGAPVRPPRDLVSTVLAGHVLGDIPDACVVREQVDGAPDISRPRTAVRDAADKAALAADLVFHTKTMRDLADCTDQPTTLSQQLAAHVLSSSCPNSDGGLLQCVPYDGSHIKDVKFQCILKLRFGVPHLLPPDQWRCNCSAQNGPSDDNFLATRCCAANLPDATPAASIASEPLHALMCRRRWYNIVWRHNRIRNLLHTRLRAFSRVTGTQLEPPVRGNKRGDVRVVFSTGAQWILDVGACCPSSDARVRGARATHKVPGLSAETYCKDKLAAYTAAGVANSVPFIIETGGRMADKTRSFIDDVLCDPDEPNDAKLAHQLYRVICRALLEQNAYCMHQLAQQLPQPDLAAVAPGDAA